MAAAPGGAPATRSGSSQERNETNSIKSVVAASFIGTTIEWYDFFLYGTAAALVFNKLFFPKSDPSTGTLLALATYGVGFVARPIGGIIFGNFGDRIGRKSMLVLPCLRFGWYEQRAMTKRRVGWPWVRLDVGADGWVKCEA